MTREIIQIENDEQWLAERAKDITSTSVSALFDMNPYCTVFELYHAHKNGLHLPFETTDRMRKGKRMEAYAAQEVAHKLEATVRPLNIYARIPGESFGSSFDYELTMPDGSLALLELKAIDYFRHKETWLDGEAPPYVEIQVQHQLEAIDRYSRAFIAAFTGIYDFEIYERQRDKEMGAALRAATAKFFSDVEHGHEPRPDFYRDGDVINALYRNTDGDAIDKTGDDDFEALCSKYLHVKGEAKAYAEEADALKYQLHATVENSGGAYTERYKLLAAWTKDSAPTVITQEMVGTTTGWRKGYRQCLVTDLQQKKTRKTTNKGE